VIQLGLAPLAAKSISLHPHTSCTDSQVSILRVTPRICSAIHEQKIIKVVPVWEEKYKDDASS